MNTTTEQMISTTPNRPALDPEALGTCLDECAACAIACISCADACLGEKQIDMLRTCIRKNLDCADICQTTTKVAGRLFDADLAIVRAQIELCARACASCGAECDRHAAHHEHCRVCAEACRRCEAACRALLA